MDLVSSEDECCKFAWSAADLEKLGEVEIIVAADGA